MVKQNDDEFVNYSQAITFAAGRIYAADKGGVDLESNNDDTIVPLNLGDGSPEALVKAQHADAKFNVAARAVARVALLQDDIEGGGIKGIAARVEYGLTRIIERKYLRNADPIIDTIRGKKQ